VGLTLSRFSPFAYSLVNVLNYTHIIDDCKELVKHVCNQLHTSLQASHFALDNRFANCYDIGMLTTYKNTRMENREMASVREVMTLLDVSRPTVMKWLSDGKFKNAIKDEGITGEWNIPREDVEAVRQELVTNLSGQIERLEELARLSWQ
jgi:hypothetical protein